MALNIQVEDLAGEVANLAHETKTEAIRRALLERRTRLQAQEAKPDRRRSLQQYLEQDVWPIVPAGELGRILTREEKDQILGYGPEGI